MSDIVIKVESLSKQYRLGEIGTGSLSHDVNRWWHKFRGREDPYLKIGDTNDRTKKSDSDYVWPLKDVSFEVKRGEVLGIIGKNGAGKSTLLKILSRVTTPTTGHVKVKGRIASLLEVGTGFHPELSGRENIFLNGAILGMHHNEIKAKFDEIVDFAGVERYIDTPVKRYSSGMYVRLAFAVAAHLEPEILIVDEVLAVGDAEFQKKCLGKMQDVAGHGRTVLFVSHNMEVVSKLCGTSLLLKEGTIIGSGPTKSVIGQYVQSLSQIQNSLVENLPRRGNGVGRITNFRVISESGSQIEYAQSGQRVSLIFSCRFIESVLGRKLDIGFGVHGPMDERLFVHYVSMTGSFFTLKSQNHEFGFCFQGLPLNPGRYTIFPRLEVDGEEADFPQAAVGEINVISGDYYDSGRPTNNKGNCHLLVKGDWTDKTQF